MANIDQRNKKAEIIRLFYNLDRDMKYSLLEDLKKIAESDKGDREMEITL